MPSATLHLTHVEILARDPALESSFREAMSREITYARLGSVFHDLPFYTNIVTMMLGYWLEMPAEYCPFAQKMHRYQPDLFAWHFLRHAAREGLLSPEERLALIGGFFAHIALDLELHPLVNWCARRDVILHGGHESHHHRLTEKYHSLFFHRDLHGKDIIGTPHFFREKSRIVEDPPFFRLNAELPVIRWSADMLADFFADAAPTTRQLVRWIRSFRHFAFMVSLPMAQRNSLRVGNGLNREQYYENDDFSFSFFWQRGYQRSIELVRLAWEVIEKNDFSEEQAQRFLSRAQISDLSYPPESHLPSLPEVEAGDWNYQLTG